MIELDVTLPLASFTLRVKASFAKESVAILGPSGAGKTSLLRLMAGLQPQALGRFVLNGQVLMDRALGLHLAPERRHLGYVPQDSLLFPHLRVRENLHFGRRKGGRDLSEEAIRLFQLSPLITRYPHQLSGGEQQRVALARALATDPQLLLLDEPLAALDGALKERVLPYLLRLRETLGIPLVYVTHQRGEARALAQEGLLLEAGQVKAQGSLEEVFSQVSRQVGDLAREQNILDGVLERPLPQTLQLRLDAEQVLWVPEDPRLEAGQRATYALDAEAVLVALQPVQGTSARNLLRCQLTRIEQSPLGCTLGVTWGKYPLVVRVSTQAVAALGLVAPQPLFLLVKSASCRYLGSGFTQAPMRSKML